MVQLNLTINKERALLVILVAISIMAIDSTFVKYFATSDKELTTPMYVGIFITFTMLFVGIVIVLLNFAKIKHSDFRLKGGMVVKNSYLIISLTQYSLIGILVAIILQIVLFKSYNILSLSAAVYISHISALFFLILLALTLVEWIKTRRNKILSLYAISFSLTAFAIMTSLIYAIYVLTYQSSFIKPYPIRVFLYSLPRSDLAISFGTILDIVSVSSFVLVWIASAVLLSAYGNRMGKLKYWVIISIPLVYFLFPFETYLPNILEPLAISSLVKVLFFGATKQIGALFFSLAFVAASTLITKHDIQKYLLISAVGIAMLFGSIEIDSLLFAVYPPFGLVTISFMPMGAYLLFIGISLSATFVARDKEVRKEFYKTAISQLDLLKTIGVTQMEKELMDVHKSVEKFKSSLGTKEPRMQRDNIREVLDNVLDEMDKDNVREILHDVLSELYSKTGRKSVK